MGYPIAKLNQLAADPDFVDRVRTLGRVLVAIPGRHTARVAPLVGYGPDRAGTLLRLDSRFKLPLAELDDQMLHELLEIQTALISTLN